MRERAVSLAVHIHKYVQVRVRTATMTYKLPLRTTNSSSAGKPALSPIRHDRNPKHDSGREAQCRTLTRDSDFLDLIITYAYLTEP